MLQALKGALLWRVLPAETAENRHWQKGCRQVWTTSEESTRIVAVALGTTLAAVGQAKLSGGFMVACDHPHAVELLSPFWSTNARALTPQFRCT